MLPDQFSVYIVQCFVQSCSAFVLAFICANYFLQFFGLWLVFGILDIALALFCICLASWTDSCFWPLSGSTVSALPPVSASGSCSLSSMVHPWQSSGILKDRNSLFSLPETHFSLISLSFISKTFTVKQEMSQRGDEVKFFRKQSSIWIFFLKKKI